MVFDLYTPTIFELMLDTVLLMCKRLVQHSLFKHPIIVSLNYFVYLHYLLLMLVLLLAVRYRRARLMVPVRCLPE